MPRQARQIAASGIYHAVWRGINAQQIFEADSDCIAFLQFLQDSQSETAQVLAYALMGNHTHLLVKLPTNDSKALESMMKKLGIRYVYYYNAKYHRTGPLFQGRFKSQPIEGRTYLLGALRYIHNNPVKAGICKWAKDYQWSSYRDYFGQRSKPICTVNTSYIVPTFATLEWLEQWHRQAEDEVHKYLDVENKPALRWSDEAVKRVMRQKYNITCVNDFVKLDSETRNAYLRSLTKMGVGQRQLSRLTGISRGIIQRANL